MHKLWPILFISFNVFAHQSSLTATQNKLKWRRTDIPLKVINTSSSLPSSTSVVDSSITEWNSASGLNIYRTNAGNNQLKFSNNFSMYGSAVIGVTEVNYSDSGSVNSATVYLNEENYDFTDTPGMTIGNQVYLKDVVTHELGHFLGLAHSEVLNSTMFFSNFPGQSDLSSDDRAGIRDKYRTGFGKISGHVMGGDHIGILGVHVQAISRRSGEIVGGITSEDGSFEIGGLPLDDTYYLYTSPLKNVDALPIYYSNVQNEFCPARYVGSFFSECGREHDGLPQALNLTNSQPELDVGVVTINCALRSQQDYSLEKLQSSFHPLTVFDYQLESRWEKAYVGYFTNNYLSTSEFSNPDKLNVDLTALGSPSGKFLKVTVLSQPFGNPVEYSVTILQNNSVVTGASLGKTINIAEGTLNLDVSTSIPLSSTLTNNIFEIEIRAKKLMNVDIAYSVPDFSKFGSTTNLPYLLMLSIENASGQIVDTGHHLSDNQSCLDAPFAYAVKKRESVTANAATISSDQKAAAVAACGTIASHQGPGDGPGSFLGIFSLGFMLSILVSLRPKRAKNFLS